MVETIFVRRCMGVEYRRTELTFTIRVSVEPGPKLHRLLSDNVAAGDVAHPLEQSRSVAESASKLTQIREGR